MSEAAVVEEMLDVVGRYDRGDINLFEAVLCIQKLGAVVDEDQIIEALCMIERNNIVTFPGKEE